LVSIPKGRRGTGACGFRMKIAQVWFDATFPVWVRHIMKAFSTYIITAVLVIAGLAGCAGASAANPPANSAADTTAQASKKNNFAAKKTMRAFRSEAELKSYFHEIAEKQKRESRRMAGGYGGAVW